ncbi:MAG: ABC transporter ATP-binding protein [Ruminococcaceae bacterium]|nr:ABC transporter ATP-binding protein [Oscillospiraceae bacterium]
MNILEFKSLSKAYVKGINVISNLNLEIPQGRIIGLLGPNGCGKSTMIKMIAGLLQPTSGEILVNGKAVGEETCADISYLPERTYFTASMKVKDIVDYFADFYKDFDKERALKLLKDLNVDIEAKLKKLSKGTKEKVQLVLVMSRQAKLYLLDEPIAGVDPATREYILSTIVSNYNPEATIIITTHLITDVEQVLDDFIFISYGGQIVMSGNAEETRNQTGKSLDELFKEVFKC